MREDSLWLDVMLDLKRDPVGVRFLYDEQEYLNCSTPEAASPAPYCLLVKNAAMGNSCKFSLKHMACLSGARALGILKPEDDIVDNNDIISGKRHQKMGLYADYGISHQIAKDMVYCSHKVYGVEIANLAHFTNDNPDVVLIVTNSVNAMRIIQGYSYHYGQLKNIKMTGNQAVCQESTSFPFELNQVNVSLLCSGTRQVAKWDNDEMAIGIPYNKLEKIVDGIKKTSNPMDNNTAKKRIMQKAQAHQIDNKLDVHLSSNYYTGGYGTIEYHKRRNSNNTTK